MKIRRSRIAKNIADSTIESGINKKLGRQIAAYLLSERRVNELGSILRDVQLDWANAGYVEVMATSAHDLTAEIRQDIDDQVSKLYPNAKKILITEVYNPHIIGGIQLSFPDKQLDLSIKAKLNKFKRLTAVTERTS
ncbi:MAG: hypothetical protein NVS1B10_08530 [Candidatus Saccharimonadales bacterium]